MNTDPTFSIITVSLNSEDCIEKTIQSVVCQRYNNKEYIVIDGNSTDDTVHVIKYCLDHDLMPWSLVSEQDNGIYDAMNKGIKISKGNYLFFLNSGDYFVDREVLRRIASSIKENQYPYIIYGSVILEKNIRTMKLIKERIYQFDRCKYKNICQQAIFYHRKLFDTVGLFDCSLKIQADYDFLVRLYLSNVSNLRVDFPVCYYQLGGRSDQESIFNYSYDRYKIYSRYLSKPKSLYLGMRCLIGGMKRRMYQTLFSGI